MTRTRPSAWTFALLSALGLLAASPALASGGGSGSGGSGGGGGGSSPCLPLTTVVRVAHADGNGNSGVSVQATIRDCSPFPEPVRLTVSVPGSATVPFTFSSGAAALLPGFSLTMNASPIGSTPLALHYGETYNVVASLVETGATPATLATISTPVTMPPGVVS